MLKILRFKYSLLLVAFFGMSAQPAVSFPSFEDFWRYNCSPGGFNKKAFIRAKKQSKAKGLNGAIGSLNLACVQSAREITAYLQAFEKWQASSTNKPEPKFNNNTSRALINQAFQNLSAIYNRQQQNPEVLYHFGVALALRKDLKAVNRLDELINKNPKSPRIPMANLALAEFFFDKDGLERAMRYYDRAKNSANQPAKFYVQYKMAWVEYASGMQANNRAKAKNGLYEMAKLYQQAKTKKGPVKAFSKQLRQDVIDLTTEYGDINETKKLLKIVDAEEDYIKLIEKTATIKIAQGQFAEAYKLYAMVLKENAKSPRAPELQQKLIQLCAELGNFKLLVDNLKLMLKNYGYARSPWQQANEKNAKLLTDTEKLVENLIYEYATALDNDGRQNNNPANLALGIELYNLYLKRYPQTDRSYEVRFYQAQILYLEQKYLESAQAFLSLIRTKPKGKYLNDALELMVTAAQTAVDGDKKVYKLPPPGSAQKPVTVPEIRQLYADTLAEFVKFKPKDPNAVAMQYTSASIYYDFGHYRKANKAYLEFITQNPNNQFAVSAAARVFEYHRLQATPREYNQLKSLIGKYPGLRGSQDLAYYFQLPKADDPAQGKKETKVVSDTDSATDSETESATDSEKENTASDPDQKADNEASESPENSL